MQKNLLLLFLCLSFTAAKSQTVFIPDSSFRVFLMNNGFASCMSGDSLDTTCPAVVNATSINCTNKGIYDLTGIEYFTGLNYLICKTNHLSSLPSLPAGIVNLDCSNNQLTSLPTLPASLTSLTCKNNQLSSLPALSSGLAFLDCSSNQLTLLTVLPSSLLTLYCQTNQLSNLPTLPLNLVALNCSYNSIGFLPNLPGTITTIDCNDNLLTTLPSLPSALTYLSCFSNQITSLPALPATLASFSCASNNLTSLPPLPDSLFTFNCNINQITTMPALPAGLQSLYCSTNQLTSLPTLPTLLYLLVCNYNSLTSLPVLPSGLHQLECEHNQITSLPSLPASLTWLRANMNQLTTIPVLPAGLTLFECYQNLLTSLPAIPASVTTIKCNQNQITSIPNFPDSSWTDISANPISCLPLMKKFSSFRWGGTNIHCRPNVSQVSNSMPLIDTLPLCDPLDLCPLYWNITGVVYLDADSSCSQDTTEIGLKDIPVSLDSGGMQLQLMLTDHAGHFSFQTGYGNYELKADTANASYHVVCPLSFSRTSVLSSADSMDTDMDFGLVCNSGFDLKARSITSLQTFRSGFQNTVYFDAGDGMSFSGISCTDSLSGSVQVVLGNLVSYVSPAPGAIMPTSINGDTLTWSISDFALVDPIHDFNIIAEVSTSATINDSICLQLDIFPTADNIPGNNSVTECFPVVSSYDPNEKTMLPSGMVDSSQHWFTFTVFFQNTGTASAEDIYILDTLDQNLDATTFTFLSSSHDVITQMLPGNILRFNYPDIYLPDSNANEPMSHGFVKYKVKRKNNLPLNTTISNTAHIFFDFNAPVVTNTVSATLSIGVGVGEMFSGDVFIYPNPAGSQLAVGSHHSAIVSIEMINVFGQLINILYADEKRGEVPVDLSRLKPGIYFLKVQTEQGTSVRKFIRQ